MIPGEIITGKGQIELNKGRKAITLTVANTGDRPIQVGSHYHFAETNPALQFDREKAHGHRSNVRVYRDGGCLGPDVQLLGCAWLAPEEIDAIAATGTAVLLDPTAAMCIGAGMPPLLRLLAARVPTGLATNGPAANGSQDMFESMKNAAGLTKLAAQDGRAFTQDQPDDVAAIGPERRPNADLTSTLSD